MTNTGTGQDRPLAGSGLLRALAENWRLLLRGIAALAFAAVAFAWPHLTLFTLTFLWGAYALSDGIFALWAAVSGEAGGLAPRWWLAVVGIASILAGLLTFFWPGMTVVLLMIFIAGWAKAVGVLQVWGAIEMRREMEGEWLLGLSGLLSIAFGLFVLTQPDTGARAVVWSIGWFALLAGCLHVRLAFRLKKHKLPA
jgi:uncharacterized membrane protein HdeD (DUF308 family)